ncbi:MAG TPA: hypothetical protein VKB77_01505 [Terriglobales bacterium]|nr:hypothetical protein [Terriglobales bacterium]
MANPVYNSLIRYMPISPSRWLRASTLVLLLALHSAAGRADDWTAAGEQLARRIAAVTGPGAVALEMTNRSSLGKGEFDDIRRRLTTELAALGLRFVPAEQAAGRVQISISENLANYIWVAEIHQGNNEYSVAMVSFPRPSTPPVTHDAAAVMIRKTLLWSQPDRILDAAVLDGSAAHLAVLSSDQLALFTLRDGRWQPDQSLPLAHSRPWPRDLRGRLVLRQDHLFDAYLPGVFCRSTTTMPLSLNCRDSDDPWPIGGDWFRLNAFFAPARNFFTGVLVPGVGKQTTAPAFYSAATLPREKYTLALFAALDGQIHMLDGVTDRAAGKLGWGSDMASVHSECGSGWQVLATEAGSGVPDRIRVYEIPDREPVLVSVPLEFPGPVTALWPESNGNTAVAVSENLETRKYEAYRLTLACGQ